MNISAYQQEREIEEEVDGQRDVDDEILAVLARNLAGHKTSNGIPLQGQKVDVHFFEHGHLQGSIIIDTAVRTCWVPAVVSTHDIAGVRDGYLLVSLTCLETVLSPGILRKGSKQSKGLDHSRSIGVPAEEIGSCLGMSSLRGGLILSKVGLRG